LYPSFDRFNPGGYLITLSACASTLGGIARPSTSWARMPPVAHRLLLTRKVCATSRSFAFWILFALEPGVAGQDEGYVTRLELGSNEANGSIVSPFRIGTSDIQLAVHYQFDVVR